MLYNSDPNFSILKLCLYVMPMLILYSEADQAEINWCRGAKQTLHGKNKLWQQINAAICSCQSSTDNKMCPNLSFVHVWNCPKFPISVPIQIKYWCQYSRNSNYWPGRWLFVGYAFVIDYSHACLLMTVLCRPCISVLKKLTMFISPQLQYVKEVFPHHQPLGWQVGPCMTTMLLNSLSLLKRLTGWQLDFHWTIWW